MGLRAGASYWLGLRWFIYMMRGLWHCPNWWPQFSLLGGGGLWLCDKGLASFRSRWSSNHPFWVSRALSPSSTLPGFLSWSTTAQFTKHYTFPAGPPSTSRQPHHSSRASVTSHVCSHRHILLLIFNATPRCVLWKIGFSKITLFFFIISWWP